MRSCGRRDRGADHNVDRSGIGRRGRQAGSGGEISRDPPGWHGRGRHVGWKWNGAHRTVRGRRMQNHVPEPRPGSVGGSLMPESYVTKQGDCIHSIAFEKGFFPDTLWNHADNKNLKNLRKDPHVLLPGDIVSIPDKRLKEISKPAESRHRFRRKGVPKQMRVQLAEGTNPLKNTQCKVNVAGREFEATSDGDGWLKIPIPPNASSAKIKLPD